MRIRWDPKGQRLPGVKGRLIFDTYRGQMRVRSWPRKTGTSKSQAVRDQNQWFKEANHMAKRIVAEQQNLAIAMTLGTGLYPRDLILHQMSGGMYDIVLSDGREIKYLRPFRETKMFQGASLELTSDFTFPTSTEVPVVWPLPVRDTASFWNVAAPTRLTIPAGITMISLTGGWRGAAGPTNPRMIIGFAKNGTFRTFLDLRAVSTPGGTASRGPMAVVEGDYFEFILWISQVSAAQGAGQTFFTLTVEEAT